MLRTPPRWQRHTNTHHTQQKAWSTQSDLINVGQTPTPLSSVLNQTQMFSAACSCLSSSPRKYAWTPTAERRIAQSITHNLSWLTRLSGQPGKSLCINEGLLKECFWRAADPPFPHQSFWVIMWFLICFPVTYQGRPQLTCWLLYSCCTMRGFILYWRILVFTWFCASFLQLVIKILHTRIFS